MRLTGNVERKSCMHPGLRDSWRASAAKMSDVRAFWRSVSACAPCRCFDKCAPKSYLLDEATQGLDQPGSAAFYRQIEAVRRETGCAVLMISHDLHVVMSAADRVICLNGHVCCAGTPEAVASAPEYKELFGAGTGGALALYRHDHDHVHDHTDNHNNNLNSPEAAE